MKQWLGATAFSKIGASSATGGLSKLSLLSSISMLTHMPLQRILINSFNDECRSCRRHRKSKVENGRTSWTKRHWHCGVGLAAAWRPPRRRQRYTVGRSRSAAPSPLTIIWLRRHNSAHSRTMYASLSFFIWVSPISSLLRCPTTIEEPCYTAVLSAIQTFIVSPLVYKRLGPRFGTKNCLRHCTHPPQFYRGIKKSVIWPRFSTKLEI